MQNLRSATLAALLSVGASLTGFSQSAPAVAPVTSAKTATSPWSVRLAATYMKTVDKSDLDIDVEDIVLPEFDINYAFNAHWSAELVLTVPQEHTVKLGGNKIGTFSHLPPTLLAKYTINPADKLSVYVAAGVNFTLIFNDNLSGGAIKLEDYSFGPAGQIGADYKVNDRWTLNADVKRVMIRTDVLTGGAPLTELQLDPWLFSLGARYSF
jgi:outer membrane protein